MPQDHESKFNNGSGYINDFLTTEKNLHNISVSIFDLYRRAGTLEDIEFLERYPSLKPMISLVADGLASDDQPTVTERSVTEGFFLAKRVRQAAFPEAPETSPLIGQVTRTVDEGRLNPDEYIREAEIYLANNRHVDVAIIGIIFNMTDINYYTARVVAGYTLAQYEKRIASEVNNDLEKLDYNNPQD